MRRRRDKSQGGYTLIEIMITLGMIATLAALAGIESMKFVARSRRAEAEISLAAIWDAQQTWYGTESRFSGSFSELAIELNGGEKITDQVIKGRYYTFTLSQPWGATSFYCSATANIDDDPWPDVMIIADGADEVDTTPPTP